MSPVLAGVAVPAAVASIVTGDPTYIEAGSYLSAVMVGGALFGAHMHHVNGSPRNSQPLPFVIRDKAEI